MNSKEKGTLIAYLGYSDGQYKPRRWAVGVAVEVPLAVHLSGQSLIGNVANQSLGQSHSHVVRQTAALQLPAALQDGPPETVGSLAGHLEGARQIVMMNRDRVGGRQLKKK